MKVWKVSAWAETGGEMTADPTPQRGGGMIIGQRPPMEMAEQSNSRARRRREREPPAGPRAYGERILGQVGTELVEQPAYYSRQYSSRHLTFELHLSDPCVFLKLHSVFVTSFLRADLYRDMSHLHIYDDMSRKYVL